MLLTHHQKAAKTAMLTVAVNIVTLLRRPVLPLSAPTKVGRRQAERRARGWPGMGGAWHNEVYVYNLHMATEAVRIARHPDHGMIHGGG